jgi:hypothetical protein
LNVRIFGDSEGDVCGKTILSGLATCDSAGSSGSRSGKRPAGGVQKAYAIWAYLDYESTCCFFSWNIKNEN